MAPGRALALAAAALAAGEFSCLAVAQEEAAAACSGAAEGQCGPEASLADEEDAAALLQTKHRDSHQTPNFGSYGGGSFGTSSVALERIKIEVSSKPEVTEVEGVLLKADVKGVGLLRLVGIQQKGGIIQTCTLNDMPSVIINRPWANQLDGSVFWPSPQSVWGWPPPIQIEVLTTNEDPQSPRQDWYDLSMSDKSFSLTSQPNEKYGLKLSKDVSVNLRKGGFNFDYSIYNVGGTSSKWAGWEVTRVRPNGMTFFPTGAKEFCGTWKCLKLEKSSGATWFQHSEKDGQGKVYASTAKPPRGTKNTWLAHTDGVSVLVKCWEWFSDSRIAPGEGSVEIYDGETYVEVENQGPYTTVAPGGQTPLRWKVQWYLRPMPAGSRFAPGDKGLLKLAKDLCA